MTGRWNGEDRRLSPALRTMTRETRDHELRCDGGEPEVTVEVIATTEITGESVFCAQSGSAFMTFMFPREYPHDLLVHHVASPDRGGMKRILDHICEEFECRSVRFMNVIGTDLQDRVHGGTVVEETIPDGPHEGQETTHLDVVWDPSDDDDDDDAVTDGGSLPGPHDAVHLGP